MPSDQFSDLYWADCTDVLQTQAIDITFRILCLLCSRSILSITVKRRFESQKVVNDEDSSEKNDFLTNNLLISSKQSTSHIIKIETLCVKSSKSGSRLTSNSYSLILVSLYAGRSANSNLLKMSEMHSFKSSNRFFAGLYLSCRLKYFPHLRHDPRKSEKVYLLRLDLNVWGLSYWEKSLNNPERLLFDLFRFKSMKNFSTRFKFLKWNLTNFVVTKVETAAIV